ncbi:MAG: ribose ABC transporter substrate-binding protein RbsB [Bacillota bacterium]|nr:ribose ABC transporter substrate-binding protein RbsB [Bacillota bacterium]
MKRVLAAVVLGMLLVLSLGSSMSAAQKSVGIVISTLNNPFFVVLAKNAEKRAIELGYKPIVLDCQNDPIKEASNVEDLIAQKASIILLNTSEASSAVNSVKKCNKAGIPVICLDRAIPGGESAMFITSDNVAGGRMAGEFLAKKLNYKGNVVELEGVLGISATRDRGEGFDSVIAKYPGLKLIAKQTADFDRGKGLQVMENLIQAHPSIDAVFAQNDEMALGAMRALEAANLLKKVIVVGYDGIEDALVAVDSGKMTATIAQRFDELGIKAVEYADKILKGESVPKHVALDVALVTSDNVKEYLKAIGK